jgi:hypothetical protein
MARGENFSAAALLAKIGVELVVQRIKRLGLKVALEKTKAIFFYGPRLWPPPQAHLLVKGLRITLSKSMRYLGLVLDSKWSFAEHFRHLCPKLLGTASALSRFLPNTGGSNLLSRRLYTGVVRSMALYGSPVWADTLTPQNKILLRRAQRVMAVRVIRGYRTVSYEAACALAGTPPWNLNAQALADNYRRAAAVRNEGARPSPEMVQRWRERAQRTTVKQWWQRLEAPTAGHWTITGLRPHLAAWVARQHG